MDWKATGAAGYGHFEKIKSFLLSCFLQSIRGERSFRMAMKGGRRNESA